MQRGSASSGRDGCRTAVCCRTVSGSSTWSRMTVSEFSPQPDARIWALADDLIGRSGLLSLSAFTRLELNSCSCYCGGHREEWPLFILAIKTSVFRANLSPGCFVQRIYSIFVCFCQICKAASPFQWEEIMWMLMPCLSHSKGCFIRTQNASWANCN